MSNRLQPLNFYAFAFQWRRHHQFDVTKNLMIMSDDLSKTSMPPLLKGVLIFLGVSVSAGIAYLTSPSGDLILPASLTLAIMTAFGALLLVWSSWTYNLWKKDSKRNRVKEAHAMRRRLCACTESGEIMTYHHGIMDEIEVYSCPNCVRYDVIRPNGDVFIADDTKFAPPLPNKVYAEWIRKSRNQR